jgi:hypothetical protein
LAQGWPPPHHSRQIRPASIADRSLTIRLDRAGPAVRVVPALALAVRDLVAPAGLTDQADQADLVAPVVMDRVVPEVLGQVDLAVPAVLDPVNPVDLMGLVALVALTVPAVPAVPAVLDRVVPAGLVVLGLVARVVLVGPDMADLVALAAPPRTARVVLVGPDMADLVGPVRVARADPVVLGDRAGPDTAVPMVPVVLVARDTVVPVDRPRRRMCSEASTTVVARNGAVRGTPRTVSALPITGRRHRPARTGSGGTVDPLLEVRRLTGMDPRPLVDGTDRRPPAAGIRAGMGRHATSASHSAITGRSTTAASTPYRFSTRSSVAGASGTSAPGSRCTDRSSARPN